MSRLSRACRIVPALAALLISTPVPTRAATDAAPLAKLAARYWEDALRLHPLSATSIGDNRYDDRLPDLSASGRAGERRILAGVLAKARAIDPLTLAPADRTTHAALIEELEGQIAALDCGFAEWVVDPLDGPQVELLNLPDYTRIETPHDADRFVARCVAMPRYIDQHVANLRVGLRSGRVANRIAVEKTLVQLDRLDTLRVGDWPLLAPANEPREEWSRADRARFRSRLAAVVKNGVRPAFQRYARFLRDDVLPRARSTDRAGLLALPGGIDCYRAMIRVHTSLDRSPEELHELGLAEVARIRRELSALGGKVLGTRDVGTIQRRLREDPRYQFRTAAEIERTAKAALARAEAAIPRWFGRLPKAECTVEVMGMHEAPQSTIAYYRQPSKDGKRPGRYMINTYKPTTRPRYEAEALAFHESIPGHHLQIAIAQELEGLPEFRKYQGVTAYVEGWALYTERLAHEMGLYSGDLDRIGMLSYDAWRACRLVVDTGMHAMGWSRERAIDFMRTNSVLAENNIVNEVDRYLTWPGQALAYKVGQLEILALREEAKKRLGKRFDIRAFHDVVLENGAVPLSILRAQVEGWIAEQERRAPEEPGRRARRGVRAATKG